MLDYANQSVRKVRRDVGKKELGKIGVGKDSILVSVIRQNKVGRERTQF